MIEQADRAIAAAKEPPVPPPEPSFIERAMTAPNGKRHEPALRFLTDKNRNRIALAGRQSGKTWAVFIAMIDVVLRKEARGEVALGLYLSFSAAATRRSTWQTLKRVIRTYNIDCKIVSTKNLIRFPGGSELYFLGSTNTEYVETFRGGTLDIAVVDEAGATPTSRLKPLVDEILTYCLRTTKGPLIVIGTPPRKKLGWFADQWFGANGWAKHTWTGADNPFFDDFEEFVRGEAERRGVPLDDPTIRRENYVEWVDDNTLAVLPNFSEDHNTFVPDPATIERFTDGFAIRTFGRQPLGLPPGRWFYSMGVDPGAADRLAIQVSAWSDGTPNVYQVAEWVAPRNANHPFSVLIDHIRRFFAMYGVIPVYVDTSGKDLINTLQKDEHIHAVQGARKLDRESQLQKVNSLCYQRRLLVVRRSALAEDCTRTEWEERGSYEGPRIYSSSHHPDALDAFRYSLWVSSSTTSARRATCWCSSPRRWRPATIPRPESRPRSTPSSPHSRKSATRRRPRARRRRPRLGLRPNSPRRTST